MLPARRIRGLRRRRHAELHARQQHRAGQRRQPGRVAEEAAGRGRLRVAVGRRQPRYEERAAGALCARQRSVQRAQRGGGLQAAPLGGGRVVVAARRDRRCRCRRRRLSCTRNGPSRIRELGGPLPRLRAQRARLGRTPS
jgi:hypothetical protein